MYSGTLAKVLEEKKISVGDTIRVQTKKQTVEGELMPKTEVGADNTLIIKLKGGYNIGIAYDEKTTIQKVAERKKPTEFPFAKPKENAKLPKVTILWTGGTIGSKLEYTTGGVSMTVKPEELFYYIPELAEIADISIVYVTGLASEDLTYVEWQRMAEETAKALNGGAHGVVITHGTDTMHYSSAVLSFMLKNLNAPVVFTGAQRSGDRGSSDAFLNLICAVQLAAKSDIAEVGICMHATSSDDKQFFIRGTKARKMHTSRRDAFRPVNDKPIAYVTAAGEITYNNEYKKVSKQPSRVEVAKSFEPKVALVKVHPNSEPDIINYYISKGYRGIIIEGTGLGHVPTSTEHPGRSWIGVVKHATESGVVVGVTSQCLYGRVNSNVYKNLRLLSKAGAVNCEDMLPEVALVKLGWLLGNGTIDKAKEMLGKNMTGEIKERLNLDEFLV